MAESHLVSGRADVADERAGIEQPSASTHHKHASPYLAHHFDDLEQQFEASRLGMWAFLATEVMFFGGLFMVYTAYRSAYPNVFAEASHHLSWRIGALNTIVLLTSSLTMALAVWAGQTGKRRPLIRYLAVTTLLGIVFLVFKTIEYADKYEHHLIPFRGLPFIWEGDNPGPAKLFFSIYFAMTGFHALHMIIGIVALVVLIVMAMRGRFAAEYYTPIEMFGLYWHFVDIVWVFLYPLLYLIGGIKS